MNIHIIKDYEDTGDYLYVAGDCSRAYAPEKMDFFTRQILFIRPDTFILFDRVKSKNPGYKKTMLLQAMKLPLKDEKNLVLNNGKGKLFIQNLLPRESNVNLYSEEKLYSYNGNTYPPDRITGPAPECRIEISPERDSKTDYFLTVITASESGTTSVPQSTVQEKGNTVTVTISGKKYTFNKASVDLKM